jgi:hypothetical protein
VIYPGRARNCFIEEQLAFLEIMNLRTMNLYFFFWYKDKALKGLEEE